MTPLPARRNDAHVYSVTVLPQPHDCWLSQPEPTPRTMQQERDLTGQAARWAWPLAGRAVHGPEPGMSGQPPGRAGRAAAGAYVPLTSCRIQRIRLAAASG